MMVPVTVNKFVAGLHGPGTAVRPVMLHKIAQLVVPSVPGAFSATAVIFVGNPEKLVISIIYHCPATAPVISICSVAAVE